MQWVQRRFLSSLTFSLSPPSPSSPTSLRFYLPLSLFTLLSSPSPHYLQALYLISSFALNLIPPNYLSFLSLAHSLWFSFCLPAFICFLSSLHSLLLSGFFLISSSYPTAFRCVALVVPRPLASCLRTVALPMAPCHSCPHSPSLSHSFLLQLVFLCVAKKLAPYFQTYAPKARPPFFLHFQIKQTHGRALIGQPWLVSTPCMVAWGMDADGSKASFLCTSLWLEALPELQSLERG